MLLASRSPRRRELLEGQGLSIEVIPSSVVETRASGESAEQFALRMAVEKAESVAAAHPGRWTLGADTVVVIGDEDHTEILGKPCSPVEAAKMLRQLSGNRHRVISGVAFSIAHGSQGIGGRPIETESWVVESRVRFRRLAQSEIDRYVESGEPMDKAGSYAIQGAGGDFVENYEGSWSNIVGLPMESVVEWLERKRLF